MRPVISEPPIDRLKERYLRDGLSIRAIGAELSPPRSYGYVRARLVSAHVKLRDRGGYRGQRSAARRQHSS